MSTSPNTLRLLALAALFASAATPTTHAQNTKLAPVKPVSATASSANPKFPANNAIDGVISDASRWVSLKSATPAYLDIKLPSTQKLGGAHIFTGMGDTDVVEAFSMQFWKNGKWIDIPSASVDGNHSSAVSVPFDQTVDVITDKIRLTIRKSHQDIARVKEVVLWPYSPSLPPLPDPAATTAKQSDIPEIYLNQSGFNLGEPKIFTAPTLADGTKFIIRPAQGGAALFSGIIQHHKGDFTPFNPHDTQEFVVNAATIHSVPFRIGNWWLERVTYQNMVNFMIDSRHYLGNEHARCPGSFGWRDDHHFGWELHSLVPQYLSNPSAYDRMPRQVRYVKPSDPKLWGALQPYPDDAPDLVKLIHWGADVIVTQGLTHEMLKSQLAYFLYAWPVLKQYLPEQNYQIVRDYAFKHWTDPACDRKFPYDESPEHNLLALKTKIGSTKGPYPPGFSIAPNVLMYEVAKREKRPDADLYLKAAKAEAEWIMHNLNWSDPLVTKGQRMSEFITMTGLADFLRMEPDKAPPGLAAKIGEWAGIMIRRSDNMWDFRKLDDANKWTPMDPSHPQKWNEPGNVVGLPASLLAAREVITDPATKARLDEIAWAHFDDMFGRNPTGRHFSFDAPREIEGVEFGWFTFCPGGIGKLANARFVIDASPKDFHYPYHPELGNKGYTEGWIQFNTPFNASMAYLAFSRTRIALTRANDELVIRLEAPLNFDYSKVESGSVTVTAGSGDTEQVTVTEESPDSRFLSGRIRIQPGPPAKGSLQAKPGDTVEASYGYGYLGRKALLKL